MCHRNASVGTSNVSLTPTAWHIGSTATPPPIALCHHGILPHAGSKACEFKYRTPCVRLRKNWSAVRATGSSGLGLLFVLNCGLWGNRDRAMFCDIAQQGRNKIPIALREPFVRWGQI